MIWYLFYIITRVHWIEFVLKKIECRWWLMIKPDFSYIIDFVFFCKVFLVKQKIGKTLIPSCDHGL